MDTTAASTRPHDRRLLLIVALAAALVGVLAGRWSPGSTPAGAAVATWHAPAYTDPGWEEGFEDTAPGYGIDGEEIVHLRGILVATEMDVERANGTSGPWLAHAFTLPCGFRPTQTVVVGVGGADHALSTPYRSVIHITVEGVVMAGAWDVPVEPIEDPAADYLVMLDAVTFEAAPDTPECVDEEPTTTTTTTATTTTEPETTTTTTEPEE